MIASARNEPCWPERTISDVRSFGQLRFGDMPEVYAQTGAPQCSSVSIGCDEDLPLRKCWGHGSKTLDPIWPATPLAGSAGHAASHEIAEDRVLGVRVYERSIILYGV